MCAGPARRGTGYLVTSQLVLTAAHVLAGVVSIRLRFNADQPGEWSAEGELTWSDPVLDVALIRIVDSSITPLGPAPAVAPVRFGRIAQPAECEALGFPRFKLREDATRPGADGRPSKYRDSHHAIGIATPWSNLREGTMEVNVRAPEYDPDPAHSPWEGMSGAAVWSGGYLIGVVGKHHRSDGLGTLSASRVDRWHSHLTASQVATLGELIARRTDGGGLGEVPTHEEAGAAVPRHQLPATTRAFTGRADELQHLIDLAASTSRTGAVVISAIDGMAGIGKTALAIHAAHRMSDHYPDGQLFLDLHGYTAGIQPTKAGDALEWFLRSLGVPPQQIPSKLDERAALYRDRLVGTKTLIILDNVSNEAQVRPLLPGSPECLVVITSRKRLSGLDDAYSLALDVLPEADAVTLFRAIAGPERVPVHDSGLAAIITLCGHVPLAIRIAAARLRHRPALTAQNLAQELREESTRLSALQDSERSVSAALDLSYQHLPSAAQHTFRYLGRIPGPDFDAYAVANLTDTDYDEARRSLETLLDYNLLTQHTPGRYRFHDLVRVYAQDLTTSSVAADARPATLCGDLDTISRADSRLLDYYLYTSQTADRRLDQRNPRTTTPVAVTAPRATPDLDTPDQAQTWFAAELRNLDAATQYAADHHHPARAVAQAAALAQYLHTHGPWTQAVTLHKIALAAAQRIGDRAGQANALTDLGIVQWFTGAYAQAHDTLTQALDLYRTLGDPLGQANALTELGIVMWLTGAYAQAHDTLTQALDLYRTLGDRLGQANALTQLGGVQRLTGAYAQAHDTLTQALDLYRVLSHRRGQANALTQLGGVQQLTGAYAQAHDTLTHALDLYRTLGDRGGEVEALNLYAVLISATSAPAQARNHHINALRLAREIDAHWDEANALDGIAGTYRSEGRTTEAKTYFRQALELYRSMGCAADVIRTQAALDGLANPMC